MPDPTRQRRGRAGALKSWESTTDRPARTAPARAALDAKFEALADPDSVLSQEERARCVEHLRRAHMARLSYLARRARKEQAS